MTLNLNNEPFFAFISSQTSLLVRATSKYQSLNALDFHRYEYLIQNAPINLNKCCFEDKNKISQTVHVYSKNMPLTPYKILF